MDISKAVIAKTLLPIVPSMIKLVLMNRLSLSPCSDKQDAQVELIIFILRAFASNRNSVQVMQERSLRDAGIKGQLWISKITAPAGATGSSNIQDAVVKGIQLLGDGTERYDLPEIADVEAEWTGFRKDANKKTPRSKLNSEEEHYKKLMQEVRSDVTILYFHGGAHFLMDPASHRGVTSKLAEITGGRCLSVRYRLAPQNPFPAALLDALMTYLYLLAPPEGSYHQPVPASSIVFAGDSAGGNLASALMLLLLTLTANGFSKLSYHGKEIPLELPAGLATNSPWCDIGRSLPSIWTNAKYDYLDPPKDNGLPANPLPPDSLWPAKPPRSDMYCTSSMLAHPLVSPMLATPEQWRGCPPTFICGGSEGLLDEYSTMARNIYLANTPVIFEGYEGMPHCFAMIYKWTAQSIDCYQKWAEFCSNAVSTATSNGTTPAPSSAPATEEKPRAGLVRKDTARWWKAKTSNPMVFIDIPFTEIGVSNETVREKIAHVKAMAMEREQKDLDKYYADKGVSTGSSIVGDNTNDERRHGS